MYISKEAFLFRLLFIIPVFSENLQETVGNSVGVQHFPRFAVSFFMEHSILMKIKFISADKK